ncbi:GIY-YIG nuclease family protein [Streptomyces sp. NPDC005148]
MTSPIARCLGMDDGVACVDAATSVTPVPLCTPHRMEVAIGIVPEMLNRAAGRGDGVPQLPLTDEQADAVRKARPVPSELGGQHAPRVYFIEHGNRVKIGYTTNLRKRLSDLSLRVSNVRIVLQGGFALERALHVHFAALRVEDTEWFRNAPAIREYVTDRLRPTPTGRLALAAGPGASELVTAVVEAVGDDNGVHLRSLLPKVERLGIPDTATLRARLEEEGIPLRRSFRTREGAGRTGVHREDLAAQLEHHARFVIRCIP